MNPWVKRCFEKFNITVKDHPKFDNISASGIRKRMVEGKEWENLVPKEVTRVIEKIDLKKRLHTRIRLFSSLHELEHLFHPSDHKEENSGM